MTVEKKIEKLIDRLVEAFLESFDLEDRIEKTIENKLNSKFKLMDNKKGKNQDLGLGLNIEKTGPKSGKTINKKKGVIYERKLIAAIFLILMIYGCGGSYNGLTLNKKIPENHIDDTKKPSNPGVPLNEEEVNISLFNEYFGEWECVDDCDSPCPFDLSLEFVKDGDKILVYTAGSKDSAKLELNKDGSLYRSLTSMAYGYPNSLGCLMTIEDSSLIYECIYYAEGSEENNIDEYYQVCQSAIFEKKS